MKKAIALVVFCLLACTTMALATETLDAVQLNKTIPANPVRTGSCAISAVPDTANVISLWSSATWVMGSAHGMYIDPAADQVSPGGCSAPFYPFHATSIDFLMVPYNDDTTEVGLVATYEIQLTCPKDFGSGTVTEDCQGPGVAFATYTMTVTMLRDYYDASGVGLLFWFNFPVDVCIDHPFFLTARLVGWTGGPTTFAPQIIWHQQNAALTQAGKRCDNWLSLPAVGYTCWLLDGYDIGYGCTTPPPGFTACFPGAAYMFVNGDAGAQCTPNSACAPLPNNYPGDDASNPIVVNATPWSTVVDLCQYTSDYNYYDDAGAAPTTTRRFTGRGNDAVLQIAFDPALPAACFAVTLTPMCTAPDILRLRTWITDSYGPLYWGNPQYPAANAAQAYNFTSSGVGCQAADTYLLYIDGYPCCCPVSVSYTGDVPLPVELTSFQAIAGNGEVTVSWATASERDMDVFQITRDGEVVNETPATNNPTGHAYTFVDRNLVNGRPYTYRLAAYALDGSVTLYPRAESATPMANIVTEYALGQNYPNPFNPSTSISYAVKDAGLVTLTVYTIDGREVATLVNNTQETGNYTVSFDGSDLASGVYLYSLTVNGFSATHKMVLMK